MTKIKIVEDIPKPQEKMHPPKTNRHPSVVKESLERQWRRDTDNRIADLEEEIGRMREAMLSLAKAQQGQTRINREFVACLEKLSLPDDDEG